MISRHSRGIVTRRFSSLRNIHTYKVKAFGEASERLSWTSKKVNAESIIRGEIESLLAALTGCESSTASFYAKKNKMSFQGITFQVEADFDYISSIAGCSAPNEVRKIKMEVEVETSDSQEQVDKLKKIVHTYCPIYNMIKLSGVDIQSDWKKKVERQKD